MNVAPGAYVDEFGDAARTTLTLDGQASSSPWKAQCHGS